MRKFNSTVKWTLIAVGTGTASVLLWLFVGLFPYWAHHSQKAIHYNGLRNLNLNNYPELGLAGQFGDSFGFANAFFSSLALAFVVLALILQMQQLKSQISDAEATKLLNRKSITQQLRQTRISGFQALAEYYRAQRSTKKSDIENYIASGREDGYMKMLGDELLNGSKSKKRDRMRVLASEVQRRCGSAVYKYQEVRDSVLHENLPFSEVENSIYILVEDLSFFGCFPIEGYGFSWDIAELLSQASSILSESDLDPTFDGIERIQLKVKESDLLFNNVKQLQLQAAVFLTPHET